MIQKFTVHSSLQQIEEAFLQNSDNHLPDDSEINEKTML
jgi:hypothetical protein